MRFIQIMDYETTRGDEIDAWMKEVSESGQEMPNIIRLAHTRDHDNPNHYVDIIEFTNYDDAMRNSAQPETDAMARDLAALCTSGPTYANLDVMMERPA